MNEIFKENQFDLIIEKAGLDSIATKETPDVPVVLRQVYNQIYKVLKPGGLVFSISIKNPEFWHSAVFENIISNNMFRLVSQMLTTFKLERSSVLGNLYFYLLKNLKI